MEAAVKQKKELKLVNDLGDQLDSFTTAIINSIKKTRSEVGKMVDGEEGVAVVQAYKAELGALEDKIDVKFQSIYSQYVCLLADKEALEKKSGKDTSVSLEKARIDNLLILLNKKVKESSAPTSVSHHSVDKKSDQTFLKKIEPPDFKGDIIEYADFVRKWKAQVGKANLSAESELDRLRDHVPGQAAKALYGESSMAGAWKVLDKLYGDRDLLANKLKIQLKSIKPKGRKDQDIIIDLVTDVNNIVLRLKALNMEQMLIVDSDFLSAIYRVLPSPSQEKWLEFDKDMHTSKWEAFMKFLDQARDKALQSKVLLSSYDTEEFEKCRKCGSSSHRAKNCTDVKANSATVSKVADEDSDEDNEKKSRKLKKRQKDECGKCPLCSKNHTYIRWKDKDEWPTDRMFRCDNFVKLSLKDRAAALEKYKCCPKCTSWNHKKADCVSGARCAKLVNGKKCDGDHSSLVCGSGSAYCGSMRVTARRSSSSKSSSSSCSLSSRSSSSSSISLISSVDTSVSDSPFSDCSDDSFPDIEAVTLLLFQDVNVLDSEPARYC